MFVLVCSLLAAMARNLSANELDNVLFLLQQGATAKDGQCVLSLAAGCHPEGYTHEAGEGA